MCGRYTLTQTDIVAKRFNLAKPSEELRKNFNVAPGHIMPVVTEDESGRHLNMMKWGLIPVWSKDPKIGYKLINARSETIFEKPTWRSVIKTKRCLIPATGFYEWDKLHTDGKAKQPYFIHPKDTDLFAFGGVWSTWKDAEGVVWNTYSIVTTEPNKEMSSIHDREPLILRPEDEEKWLSPSSNNDRNTIEALLRPLEDGSLDMFAVSSDVNSVKNNDEHLIYPLG